jgi:hypothetical protein
MSQPQIWYNCDSTDWEQLELYDHVIIPNKELLIPIGLYLGFRWVHLSYNTPTDIRDKLNLDDIYANIHKPEQIYFQVTKSIPTGILYSTFIQSLQHDPKGYKRIIRRLILEYRNSSNGICIDYINQNIWNGYHRFGWNWVIQNSPINKFGIPCDLYLDHTFTHGKMVLKQNNILPYTHPWIGFFHHGYRECLKVINDLTFQESLKSCLGIITLSQDLKNKLSPHLSTIPIFVLYHPIPMMTNTIVNSEVSEKRLIQIGSWYRVMDSICKLPHIPNWTKIRLQAPLTPVNKVNTNVIDMKTVPNKEYDHLMRTSVVYLELTDASAVNTVLECISYNTPIIINRLPAIEEYLGKDYPLYYDQREDVLELLNKIPSAKDYLTKLDFNKFDIMTYTNNFQDILKEILWKREYVTPKLVY